MTDTTSRIREIAARLLTSSQVDIFMGWEKGQAD
jgi:hypothetical protein